MSSNLKFKILIFHLIYKYFRNKKVLLNIIFKFPKEILLDFIRIQIKQLYVNNEKFDDSIHWFN